MLSVVLSEPLLLPDSDSDGTSGASAGNASAGSGVVGSTPGASAGNASPPPTVTSRGPSPPIVRSPSIRI